LIGDAFDDPRPRIDQHIGNHLPTLRADENEPCYAGGFGHVEYGLSMLADGQTFGFDVNPNARQYLSGRFLKHSDHRVVFI
jgi:hypothetical protein